MYNDDGRGKLRYKLLFGKDKNGKCYKLVIYIKYYLLLDRIEKSFVLVVK